MIINAKVKTGQKKFKIIKNPDFWVIETTSRPEKNLANHEIINELSKNYGTVRIVRGHTSSRKVIELK